MFHRVILLFASLTHRAAMPRLASLGGRVATVRWVPRPDERPMHRHCSSSASCRRRASAGQSIPQRRERSRRNPDACMARNASLPPGSTAAPVASGAPTPPWSGWTPKRDRRRSSWILAGSGGRSATEGRPLPGQVVRDSNGQGSQPVCSTAARREVRAEQRARLDVDASRSANTAEVDDPPRRRFGRRAQPS